jgi:phosphate transport system substrate-binding protein
MKRKFFLTVVLLLGACNSAQSTGAELHIAISPAAQPASAAVMACLPREEGLQISFDAIYPAAIQLNKVDLYIRLGEPLEPPAFAAQLATESFAIITDPTRSLSRFEAADLFSGRISNWSELGGEDLPVALWVGPASDEARQAFEASILLGSPVAGDANVAADPQQTLDAVAANPAAAGLLPAAWAGDAARIDLGIKLPLLAIAAKEPSGAARAVLSCLQGGVGQAALAEKYRPLQP